MAAMSSPTLLARPVQKIAAKAIGSKQPDLVGLMQSWTEVIGPEWAARANHIGWKPGRGGQPAKLELAVSAGEALLVQHETPVLLSRINSYFGHGAIGALVLKKVDRPETSRSRPRPASRPLEVDGIQDPDLAAALGRLGAAIHDSRDKV